jgi:type III pantothenate kinase
MEKALGDQIRWQGSIISSVVPALTPVLASCICRITGRYPLVVSHKLRLGITIGLDQPEKVGCDRLVDAAWAAEKYPLPLVTVDLGTATTFNVVDANRVFRGGIIAAGVTTGLRALDSRCAALDSIHAQTPAGVIGGNTTDAMNSGAVFGAAAMIEGLTDRIQQELGQPVTLVLTGGHSSLVSPLLRREHISDPNLLMEGLDWLYSRN